MVKNILMALLATGAITTQYACKKKTEIDPGKAVLSMRLTDAPANYEAVNLDIQQVVVTTSTGTNSADMTITPTRAGVYDILQFRNGIDTLLVDKAQVTAGKIKQIRLVLGSNNSIKVGGVVYPLATPSAQESGVKLNISDSMVNNGNYTVWVDFDAAKSIVETGGGNYKLKPVMRAYANLTNGKVIGYIFPATALATVYLVAGADTIAAIPNTNGYLYMNGVPQGDYQLVVVPGVSGYLTYSTNISVEYASTKNIGSITLHP